uniref:Ig-like domain-containing protein n=1 Tax=Seriola lalandi dorsalis TaxID=1841481 RepID=A0A3B4WW64_SERLL
MVCPHPILNLNDFDKHCSYNSTLRLTCLFLFFFIEISLYSSIAVSLRIDPNRLQFFEYERVTFTCEGLFDCKIGHRSKSNIPPSSCNITSVYSDDSGEYWCEAGFGNRSNTGSVILESPALPVTEGDNVTLRCRNKTPASNLNAGFYKDGVFIRNSTTGNMTIHNVSKSNEGLYKCSISGAGESAETHFPVKHPLSSNSTPWIIVAVVSVVLLLVFGLYHFHKDYWNTGKEHDINVIFHSKFYLCVRHVQSSYTPP